MSISYYIFSCTQTTPPELNMCMLHAQNANARGNVIVRWVCFMCVVVAKKFENLNAVIFQTTYPPFLIYFIDTALILALQTFKHRYILMI